MKMSIAIANWLSKYVDLTKNRKEYVLYGLDVILLTMIGYIVIIGVSCLFGILHIVVPMLAIHSILRGFSGGAHGKKFGYCISLSVIVFNGLGLILAYILSLEVINTYMIISFNFIIFIGGLYLIEKKVPVDVEEKPITCDKQRKKLKNLSYGVLMIWYGLAFWGSVLLGKQYEILILATGVGIGWQLLTLTSLGEKGIEKYGQLLSKLGVMLVSMRKEVMK